MSLYSAGGHASAAGASEVVACLWNPDTELVLKVWWVSFIHRQAPAALTSWALQRATARGTPGATLTPDVDNHLNGRRAAPPSGALLDLGDYTTNATLDASVLAQVPVGPVIANGHDWMFTNKPIVVPPGTGLALNQTTANALVNVHVTFGWEEG